MAFWESLAEGGVTGLFKGAGEFAKNIRAAFTGKEPITNEQQVELLTQANALEQAWTTIEARAAEGQIELNMLDAQSGSMFKGGWRPAIGWVCVWGLFYEFLVRPILPWLVEVGALIVGVKVTLPTMPNLDTKEIIALICTLLGMGGFRMYEKIRGVASK